MAPHIFGRLFSIYLSAYTDLAEIRASFFRIPQSMRSKSSKRNRRSRTGPASEEPTRSLPAGLKRLSTVLAEYGVAAEEGAVEKVSQLAEEIVEIIARNRKREISPGYYHRRIE